MKTGALREVADGVTLAVRAQPGAKKTAIIGTHQGAEVELKIAIQAPPRAGRANQALIAFLAETFSLSKSAISLLSGEMSRNKVFLLAGVTIERARGILAQSAK